MGKPAVVCEENVETYVNELIATDQQKLVLGLIIGQVTPNEYLVVHLARTPDLEEQEDVGKKNRNKSKRSNSEVGVDAINENWLTEHAQQAIRMLPGGLDIVGVFVVSPQDVFELMPFQSKLRSVISLVFHDLAQLPYSPVSLQGEKLILHINSLTSKYTCKSLSVSGLSSTFSPLNWKFQSPVTKWNCIQCMFNLDYSVPVIQEIYNQSLRKQIQESLHPVCEDLNSCLCIIDNQLQDDMEQLLDPPVETKGKKKSPRTTENLDMKTRDVELLLSRPLLKSACISKVPCLARMKLMGRMCGRAYVHSKVTVKEAIQALKNDLLWSLIARTEMHCHSLVEEDTQDSLLIHEPPRRIFVPLPTQDVAVCDYLFPGEKAKDCLDSFSELLDISVDTDLIEDEWESPPDSSDLASSDSKSSETPSHEDLPLRDGIQICNPVTVGTTIVVAVISIGVYYVVAQAKLMQSGH